MLIDFIRHKLGCNSAAGQASCVVWELLREPGADWFCNGYEMLHRPSVVKVWVANSVYGLHVETDGKEWKPSWYWRRKLWRASQDRAMIDAVQAIKKSYGYGTNVVPLRSAP